MQYPPQVFQFPQQIPGIQSNPQFQQNQNYPQTQHNVQFPPNQMFPQQNQQQQAIARQPQQNNLFYQQASQPMMQQVHTQNPSTSAVRTGSKFCDHCGKFGHTISQYWYKPKTQGQQQQNFVPIGTKKLVQPQSQSVKSSKSQRSRKSRKSRKINIQDVQDNEITDLYAVIPNEGTVLTYMKIRSNGKIQPQASENGRRAIGVKRN